MVMPDRDSANLEVVCPCCGARLKIDATLGRVIAHKPPPKHTRAPDLERANQFLQKEAARREALFKRSAEEEKTKVQLLERKFEEALKRSKEEELVTPPTRDIDLD
jgi:predicted amidophosphoribosyltransferase